MNTKTQNLVAKSTSEGWARAHNFQKLLHTVMGIPYKELGTPSQARSFISANKHHNIVDQAMVALRADVRDWRIPIGTLEPLLTSYQQFLLGHKKTKRKDKKFLTIIPKTWTKRTIGSLTTKPNLTKPTTTKPTTTNVCPYTIKALQDLQTFQNKHKLTIKDITHLTQTLQNLQIPHYADPPTN